MTRRRRARYRLCGVLLGSALLGGPAAADSGPLIAVAANMAEATTAICARFRALTGVTVRTSVGASGNLARQIQRGAPFELFISADEEYPRRVAEAGFARAPPTLYAIGGLDLVLPPPARMPDAAGSDEARLRAALDDSGIERLAIANPDHAPYGRAAREVLQRLGRWQTFQGRLVLGENVAQAARFATTTAVQAALLPRSLARDPVFHDALRIPVPDRLHAPLHQHMVLLTASGAEAANLFDFMLGDAAREILAGHGYALPPRD